MEITFLGTASAYPSPKRGVSCIALKHEDGQIWLFDCGEGSQIQIQKSRLKPGKISKIFITHLHGDHLFGLPGLLCTISQNNQRDEAVEIYGPVGLRKYVRISLELSRSQLGFNYIVHELDYTNIEMEFQDLDVDLTEAKNLHPNEVQGECFSSDDSGAWNIYSDSVFTIQAGFLQHRVPTFGYFIKEHPLPGSLDAQKLKSLDVPPGPLYARIKQGETITSPGGNIIRPSDVLGPERPGRCLVILGDTCDSTSMLKFASDLDILVHEVTLDNGKTQDALEKGHSTPAMAAKFANQIKCKHLVLTHFSQRYKPLSEELHVLEADSTVQTLIDQTAEEFHGNITAAEDFMVIPIPRRTLANT